VKQRVLTSLVLAPLVLLACTLATPYPLFLLCLLATTLGFLELRTLLGAKRALPVVTLVGVALPFFGSEIQHNRIPPQLILYSALFFAVGVLFCWKAARFNSKNTAEADLAGLWIGMPLTCVVILHSRLFSTRIGEFFEISPLWAVLLPVWAADIAGMLVGKWVGRHPLWPTISPNKTVEGSIANLMAALAICWLMWPWLDCSKPGPWWAAGLAVGVFGQVGDLFESYVKRRGGMKDSGSILPGHGGLLDRIDSLLFTTPAIALLILCTANSK
jgi:phosphatidate cytidylyltransferase